MRVVGDLGFPSLAILTACLAFPLILLFVRYKWRQDVARNEEIKRLLVLASEEEAWAEVEAKNGASAYYGVGSGFGSGSVTGSGFVSGSSLGSPSVHVCAVCFSPTTTRCAQCKAVRYCSGKCQIIHWRRGHKYECHPVSNPCRDTAEGSGYSQKITDQENEVHGQEYGTEGKVHLKPAEILPEESVSSSPTSFADASCSRDDISKVGSSVDNEGGSPTSESSSFAFSGSSCCTSSGELSNDASTSDSANSTDTKMPDEHGFASSPCQLPKIATGVDNISEAKPPSPKFASLANSLHMSTDLSKLNHNKSGCNGGGSPCKLIKSSALNSNATEKSLTSQPIRVSSAFWERALGSVDTGDDTQNRSTLLSSDDILSEAKTSNHFSFDFSRSAVTPCSEGPKPKRSLSGDSDLASVESDSSTSSCIDAEEAIQDSSLTCNMSNYTKKCSSTGMPVVDSRELKSATSASSSKSLSSDIRQDLDIAKDFNGSRQPSSGPRRTFEVDNSVAITSGVSKPGEAECTMSTFDIKEDSVKVKYITTSRLPSLGSRRASDAVTLNIPRPGETDCTMSTSMEPCTSSLRPAPVTNGKASRVDRIQATSVMSSEGASYSTNAKNGLRTSVMKVVDQFRGTKLTRHNPDGTQSDIAGKYNNKGLFPYETFVKLYNWNKVILQPCGLLNCGNSCYANAVLQCLAFTPPLTAYFLQGLHSKACLKKDRCFTCEFEKLVLMAKDGISPLSPGRLLSQLQNNGCHLGNGREEDAHEFLRHAIETMQSICLMEGGVTAPASVEEETTLIGQTFGGYLRSKIKCLKCRGKSERQERMMDLTVEIDGDIGTLEEALRQFTGTEILDGENKYHCSRCKSYEKAKKKLTILEAPNVLTVALKRFQSGKFGKLNKPIRFPEILNLAPYMSGTSDKLPIYRIYAVVVHLDIMNAAFSGHYVCYVKNSQNKWFKTDDSTVTPVEFEKVLSKGAYMLQYARCSPRAPRLLRNRVISSDQKNTVIPQKRCDKHMSLKSRAASSHSGASQSKCNVPGSHQYRLGSRDRYAGLSQRILEEDLSDNSSLISSNSDECSCSTDSTRDSASTDDFSDYLFGDAVHGWSSPWRNPSDMDTSSSTSSSPLFSKNSSLVDLDRYASSSHETNGVHGDSVLHFDHDHVWDREPRTSKPVGLKDEIDNNTFLHTDIYRNGRKQELR